MTQALVVILALCLVLYCLYLLMGMGFIWTVAAIIVLLIPSIQTRRT